MSKELKTENTGKIIIVDDTDFDRVIQYKWYANKGVVHRFVYPAS